MQSSSVKCSAVQFRAVPYNTLQFNAATSSPVQLSIYSTVHDNVSVWESNKPWISNKTAQDHKLILVGEDFQKNSYSKSNNTAPNHKLFLVGEDLQKKQAGGAVDVLERFGVSPYFVTWVERFSDFV